MRLKNVEIISRREYLSRIRSKGFWLSTIALPLLMAAWAVVPSLVMAKAKSSQRLALIDQTGAIAQPLIELLEERGRSGDQQFSFDFEIVQPEGDLEHLRKVLDARVLDDEIDGWVWIEAAGLDQDRVEYHAESVTNFLTQEALERAISRIVRTTRLVGAGYDADAVTELSRSVDLETTRVSEEGSSEEGGLGGFVLAFALFMILYMTTLIYGQQVMHGVLEEKSSRVIELMLATTHPVELMSGKLIGICLIGLTQLGIWLATAAALTAPGVVAALAFVPEGASLPQLSLPLIGHFLLLFLLGYFFYATFYAMIGSIFNNPQEAQQMAGVAVIFVVAPWIFFMPVMNDPDSTLAVVSSLIPVFTPFLMMLRIAVKTPPAWQIALGYLLTFGLCVFMVWLCARIYRVGILMYGKKPTLREIFRWVRYA